MRVWGSGGGAPCWQPDQAVSALLAVSLGAAHLATCMWASRIRLGACGGARGVGAAAGGGAMGQGLVGLGQGCGVGVRSAFGRPKLGADEGAWWPRLQAQRGCWLRRQVGVLRAAALAALRVCEGGGNSRRTPLANRQPHTHPQLASDLEKAKQECEVGHHPRHDEHELNHVGQQHLPVAAVEQPAWRGWAWWPSREVLRGEACAHWGVTCVLGGSLATCGHARGRLPAVAAVAAVVVGGGYCCCCHCVRLLLPWQAAS